MAGLFNTAKEFKSFKLTALFAMTRRYTTRCTRASFETQRNKLLEFRSCINTACRSISVNVPPDVIQESFSDDNKKRLIERMKVLEKSNPLHLSCPEEAGVLVPLCTVNNKPSVLFTMRAPSLVSHRGHVSFPGGKRDDIDKSLVDTAVREAVEEIGIKENIIEVWGCLPPLPTRNSQIAVTGVVSFLGEIKVEDIPFNHDEVSEVFHLTVEHLLEHRRYTKFLNRMTMPVFINGPHNVWGMTAIMVDVIFEMLYPGDYKRIVKYSKRKKKPIIKFKDNTETPDNSKL